MKWNFVHPPARIGASKTCTPETRFARQALVEVCEPRMLLSVASAATVAPHVVSQAAAIEPLQLELDLSAPQSTVQKIDGTLDLHRAGAPGVFVGSADVASYGTVGVTVRLNGPSARVKFTLPGGTVINGLGLAVAGILPDKSRTLELKGVLSRAGGGGEVGTFSVTGSTEFTPVALGAKAFAIAAPTTPVRLDDFNVQITAGPDAGASYSGALQLTPSGKHGAVTGQLLVADGSTIPVAGRFGNGTVKLTFDLGNGKTVVGTGPFATNANGDIFALGTLKGPSKGDTGVWTGTATGYWGGYWTFITATQSWVWTWVWYSGSTDWSPS